MGVDTSVEEVPNMHQQDQVDLFQGNSSNEYSMEIIGTYLKINVHVFLLFLQLPSPN